MNGLTCVGTAGVHGAPLGAADLQAVKSKFGFNPEETFTVPTEVSQAYNVVKQCGAQREAEWNALFSQYSEKHGDLAAELTRRMDHKLVSGDWKSKLPVFSPAETKQVATRARSEEVLNAVALTFPEVMGGSADLTPSNLTNLKVQYRYNPNSNYTLCLCRKYDINMLPI